MKTETVSELSRTPIRETTAASHGVIVGTVASLSDAGIPFVDFPENPCKVPIPSRSGVDLRSISPGAQVILAFERNDLNRPVIIAKLHSPAAPLEQQSSTPIEVKLDGQQLTFTAEQELVLRCGKSSITLTRAGKVLIRGAYLLSRSSGVNRIKGGSVQIN
jgi:hypothetical protein